MTSLFIQIPCRNEEALLPETLCDLPKTLPGIDRIEIMVLDDASSDRTSDVAREAGVERIVRFDHPQGLAQVFAHGLKTCIDAGADIIVNMDGDHQYCAEDLPSLLQPILSGEADVVIGERSLDEAPEFSPLKKVLHRLGAAAFFVCSGLPLHDPVSGFRAISRSAAVRLRVFNGYTYTLETLLQSAFCDIRVASVPVHRRSTVRSSRLMKSNAEYIVRQTLVVLVTYLWYRPMPPFLIPGIGFGLLAIAAWSVGYLVPPGVPDNGTMSLFIVSTALSAACFILGWMTHRILRRFRRPPQWIA